MKMMDEALGNCIDDISCGDDRYHGGSISII
jgi:hypothetical protein